MGWPLEARRSLFPDWLWLCDESSPVTTQKGSAHSCSNFGGKIQIVRAISIKVLNAKMAKLSYLHQINQENKLLLLEESKVIFNAF